MKSPVTGREMRLEMELRALEYRGESFPVMYHYYACEDRYEAIQKNWRDRFTENPPYILYLFGAAHIPL